MVKWAKIVFQCQSVVMTFSQSERLHDTMLSSQKQLPPVFLNLAPSLKVYDLQKKKKTWKKKHKKKNKRTTGSIIFYRSSPLALNREPHISI